jgi:[FeFe] hydrogenase H-cluster maturation GTPase HydF
MARESSPHIGIFGCRNVGKSSIINKLINQEISITSEFAGTTTDPVKKSIEIPGIGPVVIIDTAGIDDTGELGAKRVSKSVETIKIIDLAILVITNNTIGEFEKKLIKQFNEQDVPFFFVHNKSDLQKLHNTLTESVKNEYNTDIAEFSATSQSNPQIIIDLIKKLAPESAWKPSTLLGDLVSYGDIVLLITPIDTEAPEGRLILPQVQTIRDILDNDCIAIVLKEREADTFLRTTKIKPKLVITDSSIFLKADAIVPKDIPLTGFSILLAKYKGPFQHYLEGTPHISKLKDGDKVLLLESCTHHTSCDDIGRVKIPRWISQFTGKKLEFTVVAGLNKLPNNIKDYALIIQCGGCMITPKQVNNRLKIAIDAGVPVTNYGMAIAYIQGIYNRAIEPFVKSHSTEDYL